MAYFHTLTRLWEFALGGLLALHVERMVLSRRARIAAGWTGAIELVTCGMALPVASVFPGFPALWPTGCAALVLLAGRTGSPAGADRLLASRPARYVGDISLRPAPVALAGADHLVAADRETIGVYEGALVIAVSVLLAVLTHQLVERPVLRLRTRVRTGYRFGGAGAVTVLLLVAGWWAIGTQQELTAGELGDDAHPGARALLTGAVDPAPLLPLPVAVFEDWVRIERWNCTPMAAFPMDACTRPGSASEDAEDQDDPEPPARRIVVAGDSHAQQLTGALVPIAHQNNWQLTTIIRGACPFSTASEVVPDEPDCLAWNAAAADEITTLHPDAVVTLASRDVRAGLTEQTPPGFVEQWRRLDAQGIPVLALRDNPRFDHSISDCVQQRPEDVDACGVNRADVYAPVPPWSAVPDIPSNVSFVDISDAVCDPDRCPR